MNASLKSIKGISEAYFYTLFIARLTCYNDRIGIIKIYPLISTEVDIETWQGGYSYLPRWMLIAVF